jgi:hypothetical protein
MKGKRRARLTSQEHGSRRVLGMGVGPPKRMKTDGHATPVAFVPVSMERGLRRVSLPDGDPA